MKDGTFTADRLLALYDRVAEAEDAIPRLRRFVLDLAVRGKLVEQDPTDEPAAELLERLRFERSKGVKEGQFRPTKSLPAAKAGTQLYEIPSSWIWCFADDLWDFENGDRSSNYPSRDQLVISGIPFINAGHLVDGKVSLADMNYITLEKYDTLGGGKLRKGDQLYCLRGSLGKHAIFDHQTNAAIASSLVIMRPIIKPCVSYLRVYLDSGVATIFLKRFDNGSAQPNLSSANLRKYEVPLPPLAEQQRIVAKVDELMALCDRLQAARTGREAVRDRLTAATWARLTAPETDAETFQSHARFALQSLPTLTTRPDQIKTLRQTILNLAVRGKLVEQDPTDEPAAELLERIASEITGKRKEMGLRPNGVLPPVDADDAPFDLPQGWAWARFPEVGVFARGKSKHRPRNDPTLYIDGTVPFVQTGDVARSGGVVATHSSVYNETGLRQSMLWPAGTMCITIAANIADSGILTFDACFPDSVVGLVAASDFENARFFEYFVRTAKANLTEFAPATAQKNINLGILEMVLIPLPPLAEQHRIVAKIDALMALCDQLEASLTTTARSKLLNVLLHEALETAAETAHA